MSTTDIICSFFAIYSVLAGAARMLSEEPTSQPFGRRLLMVTGYVFAAICIEWALSHAVPVELVDIVAILVRTVTSPRFVPVTIRILNEQSTRHRALAQSRTVLVRKDHLARMAYRLLGESMDVLVWVVNAISERAP